MNIIFHSKLNIEQEELFSSPWPGFGTQTTFLCLTWVQTYEKSFLLAELKPFKSTFSGDFCTFWAIGWAIQQWNNPVAQLSWVAKQNSTNFQLFTNQAPKLKLFPCPTVQKSISFSFLSVLSAILTLPRLYFFLLRRKLN